MLVGLHGLVHDGGSGLGTSGDAFPWGDGWGVASGVSKKSPALVLGPRQDVIAINDLGAAFYAGLNSLPSPQRNMIRYLFTVHAARALYGDWAGTARNVAAELRAYAGPHPHDPRLADLVGDLAVRDPDFRRWWADYDVYLRDQGSKLYQHPVVGDLELGYEAMTPVGEPDPGFGALVVIQLDPRQPTGRDAGPTWCRRHGLAMKSEALRELVGALAGPGRPRARHLLVRQLD